MHGKAPKQTRAAKARHKAAAARLNGAKGIAQKPTKKPIASESGKMNDATGRNQDGNAAQPHHTSERDPRLTREFNTAKSLYELNQRIFSRLVTYLDKRVADGLGIDNDVICAYLRGHDFTTDKGEPFKVNHNYSAVWARFIKRDYPDLAPHIELRKSRFDGFFTD